MRLDLSDAALGDLSDILAYSVGEWGVVRAFAYLRSIDAQIDALLEGTLSGLKAPDVGPDMRRQIAGSHFIWFRISGEVLHVIRVLHQSRDAGRWLE